MLSGIDCLPVASFAWCRFESSATLSIVANPPAEGQNVLWLKVLKLLETPAYVETVEGLSISSAV